MKPPADHPSPEELTGYLDQELDSAVMARVRGHIESCPACAAHLSDLARMDDLGAALNEDLPGPEYWPGLKERILKRVEEEGGASEADVAAADRPAIAESPRKRAWIERFSGWRPLGWTVATAAAVGFVILTSRGILHQSSPVEPEIASRSAKGVERQETEPLLGRAAEAEKGKMDAPGALSKVARPAEAPDRSDRPAPGAGEAAPEEGLAKDETAGSAPPPPAVTPPASVAQRDANAADQGSPAAKSIGRASSDAKLSSSMEVTGSDDPESYVAEVNSRLGTARDDDAGSRFASPDGKALVERLNETSRDKKRASFRDFEIVYAAAFRAFDAGQFDLAARGFDIVSRQDPQSDLAREADVQGRMARIRIRIAAGEDPREMLKEAAGRADTSFRKAGEGSDRAACREALADERVRIKLLEEIEPAANRESYESRVRSLSDCS